MCGQPVDEGPRDLPFDLRRVDRMAWIGRSDDAVDLARHPYDVSPVLRIDLERRHVGV
jgi:hypothetical protein